MRKAIVSEKIVPVLMISSSRNVGNASLLTFLADVFRTRMSIRNSVSPSRTAKASASIANMMMGSHFLCLCSRRSPIRSPGALIISR